MPTRLLRTFGFQIALLYLVLLSVTLIALIGFVYWSTSGLIERVMSQTISSEIRGLAEQYRDEGLPGLLDAIVERSGPGGDRQGVYLLADARHQPLAGNLAMWPAGQPNESGWLEIGLERHGDQSGARHIVRGRVFELTGGYHLFVGRDTVERGGFQKIIKKSLAWALMPALGLGLLGGVLIGRYSLRRVDAVSAAGADIVNGDLSRRVPLTGSGDEFDRLAATINEMLERIETLMSGMRLVTDSLAHDLRGPLTHAKGGIDHALRGAADAEVYRETLEQINLELETILHTFEALVSIAQAEAGVSRLTLGPVDLSGLLGDLFEVYQPIAEDAGLSVTGEVAPTITIQGHRQLLGQAVANLLDNAVKFTPAGGHIEISLGRDAGAAVLAVRDSGPGIPPADRERVLERFVRLDDSRGTPGNGLGLSLVAAVAKLHGAHLELADNEPGLRVTLVFPNR